jgi:hypothetical protein
MAAEYVFIRCYLTTSSLKVLPEFNGRGKGYGIG